MPNEMFDCASQQYDWPIVVSRQRLAFCRMPKAPCKGLTGPRDVLFRLRIALVVLLCAVTVTGGAPVSSHAQALDQETEQPTEAERAAYADALAYCRGKVWRPETIRVDKQVLCLDGKTGGYSADLLMANELTQGGIFVVRGEGGDVQTMVAFADLLRRKDAAVVVNGYCIGRCADYFFIATARTFVPKGSLVAWTATADADGQYCLGFLPTVDPRAPRFAEAACEGLGSFDDVKNRSVRNEFLSGRLVAHVEFPPESISVRRTLKQRFDETGKYPDNTYWTWNPRYHASAIRTRVFYEAYPQSQDELDKLVGRLGLSYSMIYDP